MQGKNNAIGPLPESLGSDLVPTSNDAVINQQIYWNNMWNSSRNLLPDYMTQPQGPGGAYQNSMSHEGPSLSEWNVGEASSSGTDTHVSLDERKAEHEWSSQTVSCGPVLEERQHEPVNILSLNNVSGNCNSNPIADVPLFMQSSSNATPKDLNMGAEFAGHDNGNSHIIDSPNSNKSNGSHKFWIPSASSSSDPFGTPSGTGGYLMEENDGRPGCSLDGRRSSCKRKALDGNNGQSSVGGSSSYFQQAESSVCHAVPGRYNAGSTMPPENIFGVSPLERANARLGLGVRGSRATSQSHRALNAAGNAESSHRNFRVRTSSSHQQDSVPINVFSNGGTAGNSNLLPQQQSSRFQPNNHSFDMRSPPAADNTNSHMQFTAANVPALRQTQHLSRWNGASSSRSGHSSASGVRDAIPHEESNSICMPINIAEHPMFMPDNEMRHSAQSSSNRSLTGENISITGNVSSANVASTSQTGSSTVLNQLYGPNSVPRRNPLQYPRRLSELVRRSLSSSSASESQSSNSLVLAGPSQEMELSSGARNQGHPLSHSRSAILLERQPEGTFGSPYSVRALAAASEGRGRLVSEIRSVLDLMRRGEGLRFEDLMILDQSVFFGLADVHDRHRDMRLDVDNMSYEELLALEERIGNVNTGLSAEIISKCLKQRKYFSIAMGARLEVEPCCVCQEEYNDSDDIGALDCGHEFHTNCIKKWLMQKNLCPICKTSALNN